jgi:hypothetical protein
VVTGLFVGGHHRLNSSSNLLLLIMLGQRFRHSFLMCFWVHKLMRPTRGFRSLRASDFGLWPLASGVQQGCQSKKKKLGILLVSGRDYEIRWPTVGRKLLIFSKGGGG